MSPRPPRYEVDEAMLGDTSGIAHPKRYLMCFCGVLQNLCLAANLRVEIVPILDSYNGARNADPDLVPDALWEQALEECPDVA